MGGIAAAMGQGGGIRGMGGEELARGGVVVAGDGQGGAATTGNDRGREGAMGDGRGRAATGRRSPAASLE